MQRGGAERVLLSMLRAAPCAPVITAFYEPDQCYEAFASIDVRTLPIGRIAALKGRHRATLPLLPAVWSAAHVDAEVVLCGTSGWAQGIRTDAHKIIYVHAPARWLYEPHDYLKHSGRAARWGQRATSGPLRRWDRRTMATGDRYVTQGSVMQRALRERYGIDAEVLPPASSLRVDGPRRPIEGLAAGFILCPSRLMPYKHVDVVIEAFRALPDEQLVVAGGGPLWEQLRSAAPANVRFVGEADEDQMRWLYDACDALVSAAVEPFGLTTVEAAAFGKPAVAVRAGGFVDTVVDGVTGVHFDGIEPVALAAAVRRLRATTFDADAIRCHAARYSEDAFVERVGRLLARQDL
ncbi:MAG: glycosyltransferase [Acidimicrobiales bacterium]